MQITDWLWVIRLELPEIENLLSQEQFEALLKVIAQVHDAECYEPD